MAKGDSRGPVPARSKRTDAAIVLTKAAVSAVPFVGGPVTELMDLLQAPLQERQQAFWADLAERVDQLEADGRLGREGLAENESFLDAAARAATVAFRTGNAEKRAALRNAVLNVALGVSPDEAEREMFLGMIERFTVWHLRLLKVFADAPTWATANGMDLGRAGHSTDSFLAAAIPGLAGRPVYYKALWKELHQAGLVTADEVGMFESMTSTPSWRHPRATDLGRAFLRFIEEPSETRERR